MATDRNTVVTTTRSAEETRAAGSAFARALRSGDVVLLDGDLGAGKTTYTQGIARGLGIAGLIQSPTFTIVAEYPAGDRGLELVHIDLYRMDSLAGVDSLGLDDYVDRANSVAIVEWPERSTDLQNLATWQISIRSGVDDERSITVVPGHG